LKPVPETPPLEEVDGDVLSGHIWIQERVTGRPLRFRVEGSGALTFADEDRVFDGEVPPPYRRAVGYVRRGIDVDALRGAVDDTSSVTLVGTATLDRGVDYDWGSLPAFLGVDVSDGGGGYMPPDSVERVFGALGLPTLPAVEREADARYTDLDAYAPGSGDAPRSEWRDGGVAGVLARDKSGGRIAVLSDGVSEDDGTKVETDAEALAERYAAPDRVETAVGRLEEEGTPASVDAVLGRVLEDAAREGYHELYDDGSPVVDERGFRSAVAERVRRLLDPDG